MGSSKLRAVVLLSLCACIVLGLSRPVAGSCYSTDPDPYRHYSSKTLYEDVRGGQSVQEETIQGCVPSLLYLFARHGTRFPSGDTENMMTVLPPLKQKILQNRRNASICDDDRQRLQSWRLRISVDNESMLAPVGFQEMVSIAKRFQVRYPGLLRGPYSQMNYLVQHSYKLRTKESAVGFMQGLFNTTENIEMTFLEKKKDRLLYFKASCSKFEKEIDDAEVIERTKFIRGDQYVGMIRNVTARLGLADDELTHDTIDVVYRMCIYDYVLYKDSPWCSAFTEDDLKIFEYLEDVEYYHTISYGAPQFAVDQTCEFMKDVVAHLRNGRQATSPKAVLRFGHDTGFQTFLAKLSLFKDNTPLMADNFASQTNRKWQTSKICPFGANFAFVVYKCGGTAKLKTFLNEDPITLPGCADNVCDFDTALAGIGSFADSCDFDKICENESSDGGIEPSHGINLRGIGWEYTLIISTFAFKLLWNR